MTLLWTLRLAWRHWVYRLDQPHWPGDPICRRAHARAVLHPRARGISCRPCARQRRLNVLLDVLHKGTS